MLYFFLPKIVCIFAYRFNRNAIIQLKIYNYNVRYINYILITKIMKAPILKTDAYLSLENNESKSFNIEAEDTVNDLYLDIEIEARTEWGCDAGDYWTAPDSWVENSNVSIISIDANDNEIKLNDEYINECEKQLQHLAEYAECES